MSNKPTVNILKNIHQLHVYVNGFLKVQLANLMRCVPASVFMIARRKVASSCTQTVLTFT